MNWINEWMEVRKGIQVCLKKKKDQVFLWGIGFTKYNSGKISSLTLKYSLSNLIFVEVKKKKVAMDCLLSKSKGGVILFNKTERFSTIDVWIMSDI